MEGGERYLGNGLKTSVCNGAIITNNFGDERDRELIAKVMGALEGEGISVGKAMAILDAARTALLKRTFEFTLHE